MAKAQSRTSPLRSLDYLNAFLDSTEVGFAYFYEGGVVRDCNEAIARLLRTTTDRLIGENFYDPRWARPRVDDSPFYFDNPRDVLAIDSSKAYSDVVVGFNFYDAPRRWLSVNTYPVVERGVARGVIVSFTDVTREHHRERTLRLFNEVSRCVANAASVDEALRGLVDALVAVGGYRVAWVTAEVDRSSDLGVVARAGEVGYLDGLKFASDPARPGGRGPTASAIRDRVVRVVHDVSHHEELAPWQDRARRHGIQAIVALPLAIGERRAAVSVADRDIFVFDDESVGELEGLLREVELFVTRVRTTAQLRASLAGSMAAMARVTEIRDPYTAGHQTRVSTLSAAIAAHLGLDDELVDQITKGAALHELGKIAVPAEILGRPGPLSPLEFEAVQGHCDVGADILEQAALPAVFADIARHHHERLDGSGYPEGLIGDAVSIEARIVAVADVVEAMTHHRPHRPAFSVERALDELRAHAGVRYDAAAVAALEAVLAGGYDLDA